MAESAGDDGFATKHKKQKLFVNDGGAAKLACILVLDQLSAQRGGWRGVHVGCCSEIAVNYPCKKTS
jgi:hypothetical protein